MSKVTLTQVAQIIKSELFLIIFGLISISLLIIAINTASKNKPAQLPQPQQAAWQGEIYPGLTSKEDLISKLGPPIKTQGKDGKTLYFYPSADQYRPHEVEISQETTTLIKEQIITDEKGQLSSYLEKYGSPQAELFGQHGTFALGYFWGAKGILVFANKFDGTIVEIWYFAPTDLNKFLSENPQLQMTEPTKF